MCLFSSAKWSCSLCEDLRHSMGQFLEYSGSPFSATICWESFILVYPFSHASNPICSSELGFVKALLCQHQQSLQAPCLYYQYQPQGIHCGFRARASGRSQLLREIYTTYLLEPSQCQPAYSPQAHHLLEQPWASSNEIMQGDVTTKKALSPLLLHHNRLPAKLKIHRNSGMWRLLVLLQPLNKSWHSGIVPSCTATQSCILILRTLILVLWILLVALRFYLLFGSSNNR